KVGRLVAAGQALRGVAQRPAAIVVLQGQTTTYMPVAPAPVSVDAHAQRGGGIGQRFARMQSERGVVDGELCSRRYDPAAGGAIGRLRQSAAVGAHRYGIWAAARGCGTAQAGVLHLAALDAAEPAH